MRVFHLVWVSAVRGPYLCLKGLGEGLPLGLDDCIEGLPLGLGECSEGGLTSVLKGWMRVFHLVSVTAIRGVLPLS